MATLSMYKESKRNEGRQIQNAANQTQAKIMEWTRMNAPWQRVPTKMIPKRLRRRRPEWTRPKTERQTLAYWWRCFHIWTNKSWRWFWKLVTTTSFKQSRHLSMKIPPNPSHQYHLSLTPLLGNEYPWYHRTCLLTPPCRGLQSYSPADSRLRPLSTRDMSTGLAPMGQILRGSTNGSRRARARTVSTGVKHRGVSHCRVSHFAKKPCIQERLSRQICWIRRWKRSVKIARSFWVRATNFAANVETWLRQKTRDDEGPFVKKKML